MQKVLVWVFAILLALALLLGWGWLLLVLGQFFYETFGLGGVLLFGFGMFCAPSVAVRERKDK